RIITIVAAVLAIGAIGAFLAVWISSLTGMSQNERMEAIKKALTEGDQARAADLIAQGLEKAGSKAPNDRKQLLGFFSLPNRDELAWAVANRVPQDVEVQLRVAEGYAKKKAWREAAGALAVAAAADPKNLTVWDRSAETAARQGQWAQAAEANAKAAE